MNWKSKYGKFDSIESTIKQLEIDALANWIKPGMGVLEIGCGNGVNLFEITKRVRDLHLEGYDVDTHALAEACHTQQNSFDYRSSIRFGYKDILTDPLPNMNIFDIVITDRCIINLKTDKAQKTAIKNIFKYLKPGGLYLMLENSDRGIQIQNDARVSIGLKPRKIAPFNRFITEKFIRWMKMISHCEYADDFASLHDLMLYVILPKVYPFHDRHGKWPYKHPIMQAITDFMLSNPNYKDIEMPIGQNILWVWKKRG